MSNYEPTKPYVYQPDPINSPNYPRIYALAGPGVPPAYAGMRFTKEDAEKALKEIQKANSDSSD
jgi:hypothetical protein